MHGTEGIRRIEKERRPNGHVMSTMAPLLAAASLCAVRLAGAQPEETASLPADVAAVAPADFEGPLIGRDLDLPSDVTEEDLETFAEIYADLERESRRYERAIANAKSEEEAQEIQARMQRDSLRVLEKRGWSPEKFDRVAKAVTANPDLAAEALRRIE